MPRCPVYSLSILTNHITSGKWLHKAEMVENKRKCQRILHMAQRPWPAAFIYPSMSRSVNSFSAYGKYFSSNAIKWQTQFWYKMPLAAGTESNQWYDDSVAQLLHDLVPESDKSDDPWPPCVVYPQNKTMATSIDMQLLGYSRGCETLLQQLSEQFRRGLTSCCHTEVCEHVLFAWWSSVTRAAELEMTNVTTYRVPWTQQGVTDSPSQFRVQSVSQNVTADTRLACLRCISQTTVRGSWVTFMGRI